MPTLIVYLSRWLLALLLSLSFPILSSFVTYGFLLVPADFDPFRPPFGLKRPGLVTEVGWAMLSPLLVRIRGGGVCSENVGEWDTVDSNVVPKGLNIRSEGNIQSAAPVQ